MIYAKANYPKKVSLDKFIQDDIESFKKENPSVVVTSAKSYRTAGGKVLKAYDFTRKGCSERLAYGAEGEYLTLFCISAKNSADLKKDLPTFEWVLSRYR